MQDALDFRQLNQALGNIDIYLLDQILKGRFHANMRILDAGCGEGRNLVYFIRNGFDVWGVDKHPSAIRMLQMAGRSWHPSFDAEKFMQADVADMPFPPNSFDAVISSAVLHFAEDISSFEAMLTEMTRVLRPGGLLFIRTATGEGLQKTPTALGQQRFRLADGNEFFLATRPLLADCMTALSLSYMEPFKTVVVDDVRSMAVLVLQKAKVV